MVSAGLRKRLSTSHRSPSDDDLARIRAVIDAHQPGFREAVVADARITARYRGEHEDFRSGWEAALQVTRLCLITDSFFAQVCYRAKVACRSRGVVIVPSILHRLAIITGQVSIGDKVVLRPGIYLPHGQVVIDGLVLVEEGVVLRPFVTLGLSDGSLYGPVIGRGVYIGTGAKVIGQLEIGERAQVGANAAVVRDVAAGTTVVGVPARPVEHRDDQHPSDTLPEHRDL